jgi:hypothetical protein
MFLDTGAHICGIRAQTITYDASFHNHIFKNIWSKLTEEAKSTASSGAPDGAAQNEDGHTQKFQNFMALVGVL